jgi:hypothetical protein
MKHKLWLLLPFFIFLVSESTAQSKKELVNYWLSPYGLMPVQKITKLDSQPIIPSMAKKSFPKILAIPDNTDVNLLNDNDIVQSENSVFINPTDNTVSAVFRAINSNNIDEGGSFSAATIQGANYLGTTNGGATWAGVATGVTGSRNLGDPAVVIDNDGREFVGHMVATSGNLQQFVAYSLDGGSTFTDVRVDVGTVYNDKNHLWVDNSRVSSYHGNLYSVWSDFINNVEVQFTRSTNHGITWSTPITLSGSLSNFDHGANVQTGPNGEVYVCWALYENYPSLNETGIGFTSSTNGGSSFSTPVKAFAISGHRAASLLGSKTMRHNSFPSMTVNQQNGDIYIAVTEFENFVSLATDIFLYKSTDGGTTWSSPIRVNQDDNVSDQWSPWIACDEISGALTCIFYDSRDFTSDDNANTYVAISYDGGTTWEDGIISDNSWNADGYPGHSGFYAGDYIGIDTRYCQCVPVWSDFHTSQLHTYTSPFNVECPQDLILCSATIHEEAMYSVQQTITVAGSTSCSYVVDNNGTSDGGRCVMEAGDYIRIGEGFHAEENTYFHALIHEDCETFCQKMDEFVRSSAHPRDNPLKQALPGNDSNVRGSEEHITPTITLRTFPNPTTDHFILQYEVPFVSTTTNIRIINALGMEVMAPLVYLQNGGQYALEFDATGWQAGAYTIIVQNEYSASTTRFLLIH